LSFAAEYGTLQHRDVIVETLPKCVLIARAAAGVTWSKLFKFFCSTFRPKNFAEMRNISSYKFQCGFQNQVTVRELARPNTFLLN
jgi:hypothetical protein